MTNKLPVSIPQESDLAVAKALHVPPPAPDGIIPAAGGDVMRSVAERGFCNPRRDVAGDDRHSISSLSGRHPRTSAPTCPHCGQVVLPRNPIPLPPIKQRIYDAVRRRPGITAEELRCLVWASDPNGGPEDRKVLHVHVSQLNQLLAPHRIMVRSQGGGYRVLQSPPRPGGGRPRPGSGRSIRARQ